MRIAIAYNFNDRDWFGGRNYFASLFAAMREIDRPRLQMVLVMGRKTESTLPQEFPWVEVLRTPLMDRMHPAWLTRQLTLRKLGTDPLLGAYLARHRIDLLSHSAQLGPRSRIVTMPWLYDFQFMHLPELWTPKQIRWSEQRYTDACKHGNALIVSSEDAGRDLERFAPWCTKPKYVLPFVSNPVDFDRMPSNQDIRTRYGLPDAYFHLPNQFWANKNHRLAIDALALLRRDGVEATIVCTGKTFDGRLPHYFDDLMAHCREQGVEDLFKVLGMVPHADLQGLMAHSIGVINPSRFEGWSTTVEEAKTLHKPLLLADIAVHREQAPRLGRFFAVDDANALATHMAEVLSEPKLQLDRASIEADYRTRLRAYGERYLSAVDDLFQHLRTP
jgi:glycosyltransferase involved in cell wall biosynthesis